MINSIKALVIFTLVLFVSSEKSKYGNYKNQEIVLIVSKGSEASVYKRCLVTSIPSMFPQSKEENETKLYDLFYKDYLDFCNTTNLSLNGNEAVIITQSSQCGMIQQKANARALNIKILIYVTRSDIALPNLPNELNQSPAVVLMSQKQFNEVRDRIVGAKVGIYNPVNRHSPGSKATEIVTFSLVCITILLTMGVTAGFTNLILQEGDSADTVNLGQVKYIVLTLPLFMIGMLLLLYFFYFVMVWLVIVLFYLLSAYCFSMLMMLFVERGNYFPNLKKSFNKFGMKHIDYRFIILYAIGLVISTVWIISRNNTLGLALNNIMGVYVCVEVAISFSVMFVVSRNFKILLCILGTVLLIDAIMVYVPIRNSMPDSSEQISLLSNSSQLWRMKRSSDSIMESVATAMGGSSAEEIPIRFKIPRLDFGRNLSVETCQVISRQYSLIGFGDLILPGAFICYILVFAVISRSNVPLYFFVTFVGYAVGLGFTYLALLISMRGQPALVFLLPCTVLPTLLLSAIRREFASLWHHTWVPAASHLGPAECEELEEDNISLPEKLIAEERRQL